MLYELGRERALATKRCGDLALGPSTLINGVWTVSQLEVLLTRPLSTSTSLLWKTTREFDDLVDCETSSLFKLLRVLPQTGGGIERKKETWMDVNILSVHGSRIYWWSDTLLDGNLEFQFLPFSGWFLLFLLASASWFLNRGYIDFVYSVV